MNKRLLVAILIALVAVIALGFYLLGSKKPKFTTPSEEKPFAVEKTVLDSSSLPKGFPKDFPMEAGASVLQNYEATTNDGRLQSTRSITTTQSLEKAVSLYSTFFEDNGWTEAPVSNTDDNMFIATLRKKDDMVLIVAKNNTSNNERTVEVTLTESATK